VNVPRGATQRPRSLESRLEIERLTSGLEGTVGKVLDGVTRWRPTLPYVPFLGEGVTAMPLPHPISKCGSLFPGARDSHQKPHNRRLQNTLGL
jgi:hypothetical protein